MHRIVASAALAVMFIVAACGSATAPSSSPSAPSSPAPAPSEPAPASPTPEPSVAPPSEPPSDAPTEAPAAPTAQEQYLIDGVLRGAQDCAPVRDDLPAGAIAGIECAADDPAVAQVGFYLFADEAAMLDAYFARMDAEGVTRESGGCVDGEGEGSYIPFEGISPDRDGCFINEQGYANYRATRSGANVYIGILGTSDDMAALADFAWLGNQDTPGNPTLWGER
jgi:hypothetical protein